VLAEADDGPAVLTATLSRDALAEARRTNPSLANRRL
jgi:predicted amidohydrolase